MDEESSFIPLSGVAWCIPLFQEATTEGIELTEENKSSPAKEEKPSPPELSYHGSLYPLSFDPYFPYAYTSDFLFPTLPYYQQPVFVDFTHLEGKKVKAKEEPAKPNTSANFKKNPDIPDVPPPPLPIKQQKKRKAWCFDCATYC